MDTEKIEFILEQLSQQEGIPVEEIKSEIQKGIDYAFYTSNGSIKNIASNSDISPSVEEVLSYLIDRIIGKRNP